MPKIPVFLALSALFWHDPSWAAVKHRTHTVLTMKATAFARLRNSTSSGTPVHEGIVAADPSVLPLGTRIWITGAGAYDGSYLVTDTGGAVKGRRIDLYVRSAAEARRFGTKTVRVAIRKMGAGREDAREKDQASPPGGPSR
jgi:3D (Asp-Asp-Asp) domain-containing protein